MPERDARPHPDGLSGGALPVTGLGTLPALVAVWGALLAWTMLADQVGCIGSAAFLLGFWALITAAGAEAVLLRRASLIGQYLEPGGRLVRWLRRPTLQLLWQGVKGLMLALLILVVALGLTPPQWAALLADAVVLTIVLALFNRALRRELIADYRGPLVRLWSHRLNAALLWLVLIAVAYYTPHEDYLGMSWQAAMEQGAFAATASCDALAALARIGGAAEALSWWAAQQVLRGLQEADRAQAAVAWLAFLAAFGVSFFIAWAYSLVLTGILALPPRIRQPPRSKDG